MLCKIVNVLLLLILTADAANKAPYCPENITRVDLLPVLRTHAIQVPTDGIFGRLLKKKLINVTYLGFEKKISFKLLNKCCMGYRMTLYGMCNPICEEVRCDKNEFEMCIEPNRCGCENGYEYNDINCTQCVPICHDGCQLNKYCRAPNICECMANYTLNVKSDICEARCRPGIEWDSETLTCVQKLQANVAVIAAEMDILVPDVESNSDKYEGGGDGEPAVFIGIWNNESVISSLESCAENDEGCDTHNWHNCFFISVSIGVLFLLVALTIAGRYFWKRRNSGHIVMLERKIFNELYHIYWRLNKIIIILFL